MPTFLRRGEARSTTRRYDRHDRGYRHVRALDGVGHSNGMTVQPRRMRKSLQFAEASICGSGPRTR
jgi:hypothetical protein